MLVVALPSGSLYVGGAPRRFVAELAVRLISRQFLTPLAARVRVLGVVAVGLPALLAKVGVLIAVFAACIHQIAVVKFEKFTEK